MNKALDDRVFDVIKNNPGLRTGEVVRVSTLPRTSVEDSIWRLWSAGCIQIEPDSTIRVTRPNEKVFRHFA